MQFLRLEPCFQWAMAARASCRSLCHHPVSASAYLPLPPLPPRPPLSHPPLTALSYRDGLRKASAPIPNLELPPPPAKGSVYLPSINGDNGQAADAEGEEEEAIQRALREGQPRRIKEIELLRETDFIVGQMTALISVGSIPEPARPDEGNERAPGDGRFLATLSRRRIEMLARGPTFHCMTARCAAALCVCPPPLRSARRGPVALLACFIMASFAVNARKCNLIFHPPFASSCSVPRRLPRGLPRLRLRGARPHLCPTRASLPRPKRTSRRC